MFPVLFGILFSITLMLMLALILIGSLGLVAWATQPRVFDRPPA